MPTAQSEALEWMRKNADPSGKVLVDRETLSRAGLPDTYVRRLPTRLRELVRQGKIVIESKTRSGRHLRYTVRILEGERSRGAERRSAQKPAPQPAPGISPRVDLTLRLSGGEGKVVLQDLSVSVIGASGGTPAILRHEDRESTEEVRRLLEKYESQGMQLVSNALKMQETVARLEGEIAEAGRSRYMVEELRRRVDALEKVVHRLLEDRAPERKTVRIPRIFAEEAG